MILVLLAVFTVGYTQAQQNKQVAGSKNLEVLFAPLGGSPIGIGGIKYRSFSSETSAFRVTVFVGLQSDKGIDQVFDNADALIDLTNKNGQFNISVRPGIEKHFTGTDKLSPYVGGELLLGFSSEKQTDDLYDEDEDKVYESTQKDGSLTFGLNAVAGVDYYFAQNIYLGAEFGFGFAFDKMSDTKFDNTQKNGPPSASVPNGSSISVGPNAVGQIRLGWLF